MGHYSVPETTRLKDMALTDPAGLAPSADYAPAMRYALYPRRSVVLT